MFSARYLLRLPGTVRIDTRRKHMQRTHTRASAATAIYPTSRHTECSQPAPLLATSAPNPARWKCTFIQHLRRTLHGSCYCCTSCLKLRCRRALCSFVGVLLFGRCSGRVALASISWHFFVLEQARTHQKTASRLLLSYVVVGFVVDCPLFVGALAEVRARLLSLARTRDGLCTSAAARHAERINFLSPKPVN